jgi:hypothetical protein
MQRLTGRNRRRSAPNKNVDTYRNRKLVGHPATKGEARFAVSAVLAVIFYAYAKQVF